MKDVKAEDRFQFERHGYFVADKTDSKPGKPVFNRTVGLKDSWKQSSENPLRWDNVAAFLIHLIECQ